jgi:hypothetical protein
MRGGTVLLSWYAIAETHYVCADQTKNVSSAPVLALQAKIYVDGVFCQKAEPEFTGRTAGAYLFDDQLEDGPIPDGCVGINKVVKKGATQELVEGSGVVLNAAPCWEEHWQCRYKADPVAIVDDLEKIKIPDAPTCGS